MDYYDIVLGSIPGSLLGVTGALLAIGVDIGTAVPLGAAVAAAFIVHALFVRGPVSGARESPQSRPSYRSAD